MLQNKGLKLLFAALFIVSLMVGIVAFLPPSIVSQRIQNTTPGLTIQSSKGTWWQGSVLLSYQQFKKVSLHWKLDLKRLWLGQIQAKVNLEHLALKGSAQGSLPLRALYSSMPVNLHLSGGQFTFDIAQLTPYIPPTPYPLPSITGKISFFIEQLNLDFQQLQAQENSLPMINLQFPVLFSTSNILVSDSLEIGHFQGEVTSSITPLGYQLSLTNPSKPLMMTGHSILTAHELRSDYQVNPVDNVDLQLMSLLNLMGRKLKSGVYRLNSVYPI